MSRFLLPTLVLLCLPIAASAQTTEKNPLVFEVKVTPEPFSKANELPAANGQVRRGEQVRVTITAKVHPGFHTYPLTKFAEKQSPDELWDYKVVETPGLVPLEPIKESEPTLHEKEEDKVKKLKFEHHKEFEWSHNVLVLPDAKPGKIEMPIKLRGQVCNDRMCLPKREVLVAVIDVSDAKPEEFPEELLKQRQETVAASKPVEKDAGKLPETPVAPSPGSTKSLAITQTAEEYEAEMTKLGEQIIRSNPSVVRMLTGADTSLWSFILAGIFWGGVSLITPCVFPMIPITVSFFLKQAEKEHHKPVAMAMVYSGTIIIVLTLAAAFLLSVFRYLSVNPIMNYFLGGLFIFFALSLFGMYEIELPSGLARFTSSKEGQGGMIGTIFMALTFTIISFACVAPFLGGFGGTSGTEARPMWQNLLGGLAFSVTFASPFFLLALFPTLLKKMPKSGSWLNSVKVVMGFLELAAAFKFFRSAELVLTGSNPWLFTFDFVLGIYITLLLLSGLYLLGIFRLPHDTPEDHLGVPRMFFAGLFLTLAFYMAPALFKSANGQPQRPSGALYAWVNSFLLPDQMPASEGDHQVVANLPAALAQSNKPIFVDFTGVTCTNCKINEEDVFPKPAIRDLLHKYTVVQIYTDIVPTKFYAAGANIVKSRQLADADVNLAFQRKVFGTEQLPLYLVLENRGGHDLHVRGVYPEARINNEAAFAEFLRNPK